MCTCQSTAAPPRVDYFLGELLGLAGIFNDLFGGLFDDDDDGGNGDADIDRIRREAEEAIRRAQEQAAAAQRTQQLIMYGALGAVVVFLLLKGRR